MNRTKQLHDLGQSLWLDNITRQFLDDGTLDRYIHEFSITGLTSNPTIFDHAIRSTPAYDDGILIRRAGLSGEALFLSLRWRTSPRRGSVPALPRGDRRGRRVGVDGGVAVLVDDASRTIDSGARIHRQADRPNVFVKIPGTPAGHDRHRGVGVRRRADQRDAAAFFLRAVSGRGRAYVRAIERRIDAGRDPYVQSVASLFVSRWDRAVGETRRRPSAQSARDRNGVGIYRAYCELVMLARWRRLAAAGARPQRLLWASTGTKDPAARDTLYLEALAAPEHDRTRSPHDPARVRRARPARGVLSS